MACARVESSQESCQEFSVIMSSLNIHKMTCTNSITVYLQDFEPVILLRILGCQEFHGAVMVCDVSSLWQSIQISIKYALRLVILRGLIGLHATVASTSKQAQLLILINLPKTPVKLRRIWYVYIRESVFQFKKKKGKEIGMRKCSKYHKIALG